MLNHIRGFAGSKGSKEIALHIVVYAFIQNATTSEMASYFSVFAFPTPTAWSF